MVSLPLDLERRAASRGDRALDQVAACAPRVIRVVACRYVDVERPALIRRRELGGVDGDDVGRHLRVDVAEQPADARLIEADKFHAPTGYRPRSNFLPSLKEKTL